jgi:hypothetical protein
VTEIHWIDQRGYCAGPHPEIHEGKWRYPKGRTALRRFIKTNGAVNYELVCTIEGCRFKSSPIPSAGALPLAAILPVLVDRHSDPKVTHCCYHGCESTQVEWHHFAPYNTFGVEANNFPVQPLCREHHRHWHVKMDGYQWRQRHQ